MSAKRKGKRRGKAPSNRAMRRKRAWSTGAVRAWLRVAHVSRIMRRFADAFGGYTVVQTMGSRAGQQSVMVGRLAGGRA